MPDSKQTLRIFISSPGDVTEERDGARRVVEGLRRLYPSADLRTVLWEELALPATASFQETIDILLEREPIDIAVFILWSRLGSPLGAAITKPDGTPYLSGTEREFDLMLAAYEQSGRKRPIILAYVRDDDAGLKERFNDTETSQWEELIKQRQLAESFVKEQFHDAEGRNLRAYQTYSEPVGFMQRLRVHLRRALDDLLDLDEAATWTEEPYRGLQTFDIEHAPIFHGRDEETCDLLQRLRDQQDAGCAFVVIVAASGSGKSSLARAGVAANLIQQAGDDGGAAWKVSSFIPALADQSLCHSLARSLADVLPELAESDEATNTLAEGLVENAALTVKLTVAPAFARASQPVRLLLNLDQMEELWTDRHTTDEDRETFLSAVEALARSGHVAVLATLRSDFYHHAQASATFLRLKGRDGQFDLLPPDAGSIHRLITEPARLSGLKFEQNEKTGRSLDEVVLEDAAHDPHALPLLEYTLSEMYRQRDEDRRLLTYAAYVELGGVEGAIGKRAEETFASLPADARAALDEILPLLVSVDVSGEQAAVRRRAKVAELTATPARTAVTDQLVAARFLTTDREGETPVAGLAHEALLRSWDRIVSWINANREQLRLRARVEQLQQRWEQQDRDDSLLLAEGLPLDEGWQLLQQASHLLSDPTKDYIEASIAYQERKSRQSRRRRTAVLSTIAALLVVIIVGGVYLRRSTNASTLVEALVQAKTSAVPDILDKLASYPTLAEDELVTAFNKPAESAEDKDAKLHAALALLGRDDRALPYLKERLLEVSAAQFDTVRQLMEGHKGELIDDYWGVAKDGGQDDRRRFQAACALASYDPENARWQDNRLTELVANQIAGALPSELVLWREALQPVRDQLTPALDKIYRDKTRGEQVRSFATDTLRDYLSDDVDGLFELLMDAEPKQFASLFDGFAQYGDQAIAKLENEINRELKPTWNDSPLDPSWQKPSAELVQQIEQADGIIAERFAFCQTLSFDEFPSLAEGLTQSGYRPIRMRPYAHQASVQVAAAWTRDGRAWRLATGDSPKSMVNQDESMRGDGFVAVDVAGFLGQSDDNQHADRYTGLWVKQQRDDEDARIYVGVPDEQHKHAYGELKTAGYKFQHSLQGFRGASGAQNYCGVRSKAAGKGSWSWNQTVSTFDGTLYLDKIHWDIDPSRAADPETTIQQNERALADAEVILKENEGNLQARYDRGKALFYLGRADGALADMGYVVQQAPSAASAYQYRSILYARAGDADAARADLLHYVDRSTSKKINAYLDVVVSAHLGEEAEAINRLESLLNDHHDDGLRMYAACAYSIASSAYESRDAGKAARYANCSVDLLGDLIATGNANDFDIQGDSDLDPIRGHNGYVELMKVANLDLRYTAVWNESTHFESSQSHGLSPQEHLSECRKLHEDGYRLVSASAASMGDDVVTASVWHRPLVPREERIFLAKRQANAAAALARLVQAERLFPALRVTDDPESLTQFVHRCREDGVKAAQLLACLKLADENRQALIGEARVLEDRVLFGLLLALGEFGLGELPHDQQQTTVDTIGQCYRDDPSSAIHGAAGWLLRRWGQRELVRQVDQTPRPYDPTREWFTVAIEADQQTFYQTYVVILPGEYTIGSPADEPGRAADERLNLVKLTRPVAILDREITRGEFEASGVYQTVDEYAPTMQHPMLAPSWYDSVQFCRWLTEHAGFSEADQAYADPSVLDVTQYPRDNETSLPRNWPVRLETRGFRLPTEAEWEVAARAGMRTMYSFGGDESLLDQYGWFQGKSENQSHVAKELRPNLRGLFDMQGNVFEWCHDWYVSYPLGSLRENPLGSSTGSNRVARGGSFLYVAARGRSADRFHALPTFRPANSGLRVAFVPFESREPESEGLEGVSGAVAGEAERTAEPGGD